MRDVFYTLLVVWIIWRILEGFNNIRSAPKPPPQPQQPRNDSHQGKKKLSDNEGEYVDFEEVN